MKEGGFKQWGWIIPGLMLFCLWAEPAAGREQAAGREFELTWCEFQELERAREAIDPEAIDYDLLSAAVLHETNKRRAEENLPALKHHAGAREAAAMQAEAMAEGRFVSHLHPDRDKRKLQDRLGVAGLRPRFAAENVAKTFGLQYEPGRPVFPRTENGERVFSYEPGGEPLPMHTYLSYAEALVGEWMESPGHRKNILHQEMEKLGAGQRLRVDDEGMEVFYAVQVFFTPLD